MLNDRASSKIGFYVVIGFLVAALCFFIYQTAEHRSAYKWRGVEINFQKEKVETAENAAKQMQKLANQYYTMAMQYEQVLRRGVVMERDTTIMLKKGTLIIPPMPEKKVPESQQQ